MEQHALYLEADEDITSAIDKLKSTPAGPVQIVVPKRSTLLQSVINLKLLKKAAEDNDHELVLVTTDKVASDLAGRLGLAVAASVGAKAVVAEVAAAPDASVVPDEVIEDDAPVPAEKPEKPAKEPKPTKAEKAKAGAAAGVIAARELADDEPAEPEASAKASEPPKSGKKGKVPNYNKFQKRIIIGLIIIGLIAAYFVAMYFISTAKVVLFIQAQPTSVSINFAAATTGNPSPADGIVGAQTVQNNKTVTSTFQATGSQDNGTKASGTINLTNHCFNPGSIPAGTSFTASGLTFTSTSSVPVPDAQTHSGTCNPTTAAIPVTASANGGQYNLAPTTYTSPNLPSSGASYVGLAGGQMSGGTSNIVKVVSAGDVTTAQAAALSANQAAEQKDLVSKTPAGYLPLTSSFTQTPSNVSSNPDVGQPATSANLTMQVAYSMVMVKKTDLQSYLEAEELKQMGPGNQIYDNGLSTAQITANGKTTAGLPQFKLSTTAYGGPKIDTTAVAKQLAGKRLGDATETASALPGVTQAQITISPPWASSLPHIASHITVKLSVANSK